MAQPDEGSLPPVSLIALRVSAPYLAKSIFASNTASVSCRSHIVWKLLFEKPFVVLNRTAHFFESIRIGFSLSYHLLINENS